MRARVADSEAPRARPQADSDVDVDGDQPQVQVQPADLTAPDSGSDSDANQSAGQQDTDESADQDNSPSVDPAAAAAGLVLPPPPPAPSASRPTTEGDSTNDAADADTTADSDGRPTPDPDLDPDRDPDLDPDTAAPDSDSAADSDSGTNSDPRRVLPEDSSEATTAEIDEVAAILDRREPGLRAEDLLLGDSDSQPATDEPATAQARKNAQRWAGLTDAERAVIIRAHPDVIGRAPGIDPHSADTANRLQIARDIADLSSRDSLTSQERRRLRDLRRTVSGLRQAQLRAAAIDQNLPVRVLAYDPAAFGGRGRALVAFGNPDTATQVSVHVAGRNSTVADIGAVLQTTAARHAAAAGRLRSGDSLASIAWIGYRTPSRAGALVNFQANRAARLLRRDLAILGATRTAPGDKPSIRIVAEGYGVDVTAAAGKQGRLSGLVGEVVLTGIPGDPILPSKRFGDDVRVFVPHETNGLYHHWNAPEPEGSRPPRGVPVDTMYRVSDIEANRAGTAPYLPDTGPSQPNSPRPEVAENGCGPQALWQAAAVTGNPDITVPEPDSVGQDGMDWRDMERHAGAQLTPVWSRGRFAALNLLGIGRTRSGQHMIADALRYTRGKSAVIVINQQRGRVPTGEPGAHAFTMYYDDATDKVMVYDPVRSPDPFEFDPADVSDAKATWGIFYNKNGIATRPLGDEGGHGLAAGSGARNDDLDRRMPPRAGTSDPADPMAAILRYLDESRTPEQQDPDPLTDAERTHVDDLSRGLGLGDALLGTSNPLRALADLARIAMLSPQLDTDSGARQAPSAIAPEVLVPQRLSPELTEAWLLRQLNVPLDPQLEARLEKAIAEQRYRILLRAGAIEALASAIQSPTTDDLDLSAAEVARWAGALDVSATDLATDRGTANTLIRLRAEARDFAATVARLAEAPPQRDDTDPDARRSPEPASNSVTERNRGRCAELALRLIKTLTGSSLIQLPSGAVGLEGMTAAELQDAAGGRLRTVTDHDDIERTLLDMPEGSSALVVDAYSRPVDEHGVGAHAYVLRREGNGVVVYDAGTGTVKGYPPNLPTDVASTHMILFDENGVPVHPVDADGLDGAPTVDLPMRIGLSLGTPSEQVLSLLERTKVGREALAALGDGVVEVDFAHSVSDGTSAGLYQSGTLVAEVRTGEYDLLQQAMTLVHEALHAQMALDGETSDRSNRIRLLGRDEFVAQMVREEALAAGREFEFARELAQLGFRIDNLPDAAQRYLAVYDARVARLSHVGSGLTEAEIDVRAREAAASAIADHIATYEWADGRNYTEYYSAAWDNVVLGGPEVHVWRSLDAEAEVSENATRRVVAERRRKELARQIADLADGLDGDVIDVIDQELRAEALPRLREANERELAELAEQLGVDRADVGRDMAPDAVLEQRRAELLQRELKLLLLSDVGDHYHLQGELVSRADAAANAAAARDVLVSELEDAGFDEAVAITPHVALVSGEPPRMVVVAPEREHAATIAEALALHPELESALRHPDLDLRLIEIAAPDPAADVAITWLGPRATATVVEDARIWTSEDDSAVPVGMPGDTAGAASVARIERVRSVLESTDIGVWADDMLRRNNVHVVYETGVGPRYYPERGTLVLDYGTSEVEQALAMVHAAAHLRDAAEGLSPHPLSTGRGDYVTAMVRQEGRAHALEAQFVKQLRALGHAIPVGDLERVGDAARAGESRRVPDPMTESSRPRRLGDPMRDPALDFAAAGIRAYLDASGGGVANYAGAYTKNWNDTNGAVADGTVDVGDRLPDAEVYQNVDDAEFVEHFDDDWADPVDVDAHHDVDDAPSAEPSDDVARHTPEANRGRCAELALRLIKRLTGSAAIELPTRPVGLDGMSQTEVQEATGGQLRAFVDHDDIRRQLLDLPEGSTAFVVDEYAGPVDEYGVGAHAYVLVHEPGGVVMVRDPGADYVKRFPPVASQQLRGTHAILLDPHGNPVHPIDSDSDAHLAEDSGVRIGRSLDSHADQVRALLLGTSTGADVLRVLDDSSVRVRYERAATDRRSGGFAADSLTATVYTGTNDQVRQALSLAHESVHAERYLRGESGHLGMDRATFVRTMVAEEAAAIARWIQLAREFRGDDQLGGYFGDRHYFEDIYAAAYAASFESATGTGQSVDADSARRAHERAVEALIDEVGTHVWPNGRNYAEYYAAEWDRARTDHAGFFDAQVAPDPAPQAAVDLHAGAVDRGRAGRELADITVELNSRAGEYGIAAHLDAESLYREITDRLGPVRDEMADPAVTPERLADLRRIAHDLLSLTDLTARRENAQAAFDRAADRLSALAAREVLATYAPDAGPLGDHYVYVLGRPNRIVIAGESFQHQALRDVAEADPRVRALLRGGPVEFEHLSLAVDEFGRVRARTVDSIDPRVFGSSDRVVAEPDLAGEATRQRLAPITAALSNSPVGQWALDTLRRHGATVEHTSGGAAQYFPSRRVLAIDAGATDGDHARAIVNAAIHAEFAGRQDAAVDARDRMVSERQDYVDRKIDEETSAHIWEIVAAVQLRGAVAFTDIDQVYLDAYRRARRQAASEIGGPADALDRIANQAGFDALRPHVAAHRPPGSDLTNAEFYDRAWRESHGELAADADDPAHTPRGGSPEFGQDADQNADAGRALNDSWTMRPSASAENEVQQVLGVSAVGRDAAATLRALGAGIRFDADGSVDAFDGRTMDVSVGTRERSHPAQASAIVRAAALADAVRTGLLEVTPSRVRAQDRAGYIAARVRAEALALGRQAEFHRELERAGIDASANPYVDPAARQRLEAAYLAAFDAEITARQGDSEIDASTLLELARQAGADALLAGGEFDASDGSGPARAHRQAAGEYWDAQHRIATPDGLSEYAPTTRDAARTLEEIGRKRAAVERELAGIEADWDRVAGRMTDVSRLRGDADTLDRRAALAELLSPDGPGKFGHRTDLIVLTELTARHGELTARLRALGDDLTAAVRRDLGADSPIGLHVSDEGVVFVGRDSGDHTDADTPLPVSDSDAPAVRPESAAARTDLARLISTTSDRVTAVLGDHRNTIGRWAAQALSRLGVRVLYTSEPRTYPSNSHYVGVGVAESYDPATNTVVLRDGDNPRQNAIALVRAARLAELYAASPRQRIPQLGMSRSDYIDLMLDRQAEATALGYAANDDVQDSNAIGSMAGSLGRAYRLAFDQAADALARVYRKEPAATRELLAAAAYRAAVKAMRANLDQGHMVPEVDGRNFTQRFADQWDRAHGIATGAAVRLADPDTAAVLDRRIRALVSEIEQVRRLRADDEGSGIPRSPLEEAYSDAYDRARRKAERAVERQKSSRSPESVAREAAELAVRRQVDKLGIDRAELIVDVVRAARADESDGAYWGSPRPSRTPEIADSVSVPEIASPADSVGDTPADASPSVPVAARPEPEGAVGSADVSPSVSVAARPEPEGLRWWHAVLPDRRFAEVWEVLGGSETGREAIELLERTRAGVRIDGGLPGSADGFDGATMDVVVGARDRGQQMQAAAVVRAAALAEAVSAGRLEVTPSRIRATDRDAFVAARLRAEADAFGRQALFHRDFGTPEVGPSESLVDRTYRTELEQQYLSAHDAAVDAARRGGDSLSEAQLREVGREAGIAALLATDLFDSPHLTDAGASIADVAGREWDAVQRTMVPEGMDEYVPSGPDAARRVEGLIREHADIRRELERVRFAFDQTVDQRRRRMDIPDDYDLGSDRASVAAELRRIARERGVMDNGSLVDAILTELSQWHAQLDAERTRVEGEIADAVGRDLPQRTENGAMGVRRPGVQLDESGSVFVRRADASTPELADAGQQTLSPDPVPARRDRLEDLATSRTEQLFSDMAHKAFLTGDWVAATLARHGVRIRFIDDSAAAVDRQDGFGQTLGYDLATNTVVLPYYEGSVTHIAALVRAAISAELHARGADLAHGRLSLHRDDYIAAELDRRAEAYAMDFQYRRIVAANSGVGEYFSGPKRGKGRRVDDPLELAFLDAYADAQKITEQVYGKNDAVSLDMTRAAAYRAGLRAVRANLDASGGLVGGMTPAEYAGAEWDRAHGLRPDVAPEGEAERAPVADDSQESLDRQARTYVAEIRQFRAQRAEGGYIPYGPAETAYTEAYDEAYRKAERVLARDPQASSPQTVAEEDGLAAVRKYLDKVGAERAEIAFDVVRAADSTQRDGLYWGSPRPESTADVPEAESAQPAKPVGDELVRRAVDAELNARPDGVALSANVLRFKPESSSPELVVIAPEGGHLDALDEVGRNDSGLRDALWDGHHIRYLAVVPESGGASTIELGRDAVEGPRRRPSLPEAVASLLSEYLRFRAEGRVAEGFGEWIVRLGEEAFYHRDEPRLAFRMENRWVSVPIDLQPDLVEVGFSAARNNPRLPETDPAMVTYRLHTRQIPQPDRTVREPRPGPQFRSRRLRVGPVRVNIYLENDGKGGWRVPAPTRNGDATDVLARHFQGMSDTDPDRLVERITEKLTNGTADIAHGSSPQITTGHPSSPDAEDSAPAPDNAGSADSSEAGPARGAGDASPSVSVATRPEPEGLSRHIDSPDRRFAEVWEVLGKSETGRQAIELLERMHAGVRFDGSRPGSADGFDGAMMDIVVGARDRGQQMQAAAVVRAAALAEAVLAGRLEVTPSLVRAMDRDAHIAARLRAEADALGRQALFHRDFGTPEADPSESLLDRNYRMALEQRYLSAHDAAVDAARRGADSPSEAQLREIGREAGIAALLATDLFDSPAFAPGGTSIRDGAVDEWEAAQRTVVPEGMDEYLPSTPDAARQVEGLIREHADIRREQARVRFDFDRAAARLRRSLQISDAVDLGSDPEAIIAELRRLASRRPGLGDGEFAEAVLIELSRWHARFDGELARVAGEIADAVGRDLPRQETSDGTTARRPSIQVDDSGSVFVRPEHVDSPESAVDAHRPETSSDPGDSTESSLDRLTRDRHDSLVEKLVGQVDRIGPWVRRTLARHGVGIRFTDDPALSIRRPDAGDDARLSLGYEPLTHTAVIQIRDSSQTQIGALVRAAVAAEQRALGVDVRQQRLAMNRDEYIAATLDQLAEAYAMEYNYRRFMDVDDHVRPYRAGTKPPSEGGRLVEDDLEWAFAEAYSAAAKIAAPILYKNDAITYDMLWAAAYRAGLRAVRANLDALGGRIDGLSPSRYAGAEWDRARGLSADVSSADEGVTAPDRDSSEARDRLSRTIADEIRRFPEMRADRRYIPRSAAESAYTDAYDKAYRKAERRHSRSAEAPSPTRVAEEAGLAAVRKYVDEVGAEHAEVTFDLVRSADPSERGRLHWGSPNAGPETAADAKPDAEPSPITQSDADDLVRRAIENELRSRPDGDPLSPNVLRFAPESSTPELLVIAHDDGHLDALFAVMDNDPALRNALWDGHRVRYLRVVKGPDGEPSTTELSPAVVEGPFRRPSLDDAVASMLSEYLRFRTDGSVDEGFGDWFLRLGDPAFYSRPEARFSFPPGNRTVWTPTSLRHDLVEVGFLQARANPRLPETEPAAVAYRLHTRQIPQPPLKPVDARPSPRFRSKQLTFGPVRVQIYLENDGGGGWRVPPPTRNGHASDVLAQYFQGMTDTDPDRLAERIAKKLSDGTAALGETSPQKGMFARMKGRLPFGRAASAQVESAMNRAEQSRADSDDIRLGPDGRPDRRGPDGYEAPEFPMEPNADGGQGKPPNQPPTPAPLPEEPNEAEGRPAPRPAVHREHLFEFEGLTFHLDLTDNGAGAWNPVLRPANPAAPESETAPQATNPKEVETPQAAQKPAGSIDKPKSKFLANTAYRDGFQGYNPKYPSGSSLDGAGFSVLGYSVGLPLTKDTAHGEVLQIKFNPARILKEGATIWKNREYIPILNRLTSRVPDRAGEFQPIHNMDGSEYRPWVDDASPEAVRKEHGVDIDEMRRRDDAAQRAKSPESQENRNELPQPDPGIPAANTGATGAFADLLNELATAADQRRELAERLVAAARDMGLRLDPGMDGEAALHAVRVLQYQQARRIGALAGLAESAVRYDSENRHIPFSQEVSFFDNDPMTRFLREIVHADDRPTTLLDWQGVNNGGEPGRDWGDLGYTDQPGIDQGKPGYFLNALRRDQIKDERAVWAQLLQVDLHYLDAHPRGALADALANVHARTADIARFAELANEFVRADGDADELTRLVTDLALRSSIVSDGGFLVPDTDGLGLLPGVDGGPPRLMVVDGHLDHAHVLAEALRAHPNIAEVVNDGQVDVVFRVAEIAPDGTIRVSDSEPMRVRHVDELVDGRRLDVTFLRDEDGRWRPVVEVAQPTEGESPRPKPDLEGLSRSEIEAARQELARRLGIPESELDNPQALSDRMDQIRAENKIRASQIEALIDYGRTAWDIDDFHTIGDARAQLADRLNLEPGRLTPERLAQAFVLDKIGSARRHQAVEDLGAYAKLMRGIDADVVDGARDRLAERLGVGRRRGRFPRDLFPRNYKNDEKKYRPDRTGTDPKRLNKAIAKLARKPAERENLIDALAEYYRTVNRLDPFDPVSRGADAADPRLADVEFPVHDKAVAHLLDMVGDLESLADALRGARVLDGFGMLGANNSAPDPRPTPNSDFTRTVGVDQPDPIQPTDTDEEKAAKAKRFEKVYEIYRDGKIDQKERLTPRQLAKVQAELRAEVRGRAADLDMLAALDERAAELDRQARRPLEIARLLGERGAALA
ncbi:alpha/beta hydrolase, partial [Nocardia xishanensis]